MSYKKPIILLGAAIALLVASTGPAPRVDAQQAPSASGLVVVESTQSFDETWAALIAALDANANIRTIAQVDHAAAAATIGSELDNNRVVFFGNPNLGTPIMQANRAAGIDLPQKMQVIEQDGRVFVTYNPPSYLAARHGAGGVATLATIDKALAGLARAATNTQGPTPAPLAAAPGAGAGLGSTPSGNDFETTWSLLTAAIDASPASIAFTVDHGANSGGALPPTRLVVFGNPGIGTPIMADTASAGIDLPLKMLVFEDVDGVTHVVASTPAHVQSRHGVGSVPTIAGATNAIANFTAAATTAVVTDEPVVETENDDTIDDEVLGATELALTGTDPVVASAGVALVVVGCALVVGSRRRAS